MVESWKTITFKYFFDEGDEYRSIELDDVPNTL